MYGPTGNITEIVKSLWISIIMMPHQQYSNYSIRETQSILTIFFLKLIYTHIFSRELATFFKLKKEDIAIHATCQSSSRISGTTLIRTV